jgi:hypothetical protein
MERQQLGNKIDKINDAMKAPTGHPMVTAESIKKY